MFKVLLPPKKETARLLKSLERLLEDGVVVSKPRVVEIALTMKLNVSGTTRDITKRIKDHVHVHRARSRTDEYDLIQAISGDRVSVVEQLIHRDNIHKRTSYGKTLLELAIESGNTNTVKLLLHHGAADNLSSDAIRQLMHEADLRYQRQIVALLSKYIVHHNQTHARVATSHRPLNDLVPQIASYL